MSSVLNKRYKVYVAEFLRFHKNYYTIFVQMDNNYGQTFQVTGNLQQGMEYCQVGPTNPEDDPTHIASHLVGTVDVMEFSEIDQICRQIQPPAKQFLGAKRINPGVPLRTWRNGSWKSSALSMLKEFFYARTTENESSEEQEATYSENRTRRPILFQRH